MRRNARRESRKERGILTTELAVIMPFVVIFAVVAVFLVRVNQHSARTQSAADAAARAATFHELGSAQADAAARAAADRICQGTVQVDPLDTVAVPEATQPGLVRVTVTCTEDLGFDIFGSASTRTVRAVGVSTVEFWTAQ